MENILGLYNLTAQEIDQILIRAAHFKKGLEKGETYNVLSGKTAVTLFYENSTRTRCSFEFAAKHLGANTVNITASYSSVQKGETLIDTGETLSAMGADFVIIRHPNSGAPALLSRYVKACVINAGDGMNEHPSQALLDMLTMREEFGSLDGLTVAIIGDIRHSRVAKSNLYGLTKMGAKVIFYGPPTLIPEGIETFGAIVARSREEAIENADVVMGLRIQLERQKGGNFPSLGEYAKYYGVDDKLLYTRGKSKKIIMHPGPVNRGVELTSSVIDGKDSRILNQVTSGVAVRMAMLSMLKR